MPLNIKNQTCLYKEPNKTNRGFTLIELMIVVAIIGILAAIAIPQFSSYRQLAFNALATEHINFIKTAEANYWVTQQLYIAVPAGDGPGPTGILPNTTVPAGVGYIAGVFPIKGADAVTGYSTGTDFVAFTGHIQGNRVYGVDTNGIIMWRKNKPALSPAADAKTENTGQLLPAAWGVKL